MRGRIRRTYFDAGIAASSFENECHRCGEDITSWSDACKVRGRWVHKRCHGGGDDE